MATAGVMELVDMPALGAGGESRGGSSPSARMLSQTDARRLTAGGWAKLQGAQMISIAYVLVYVIMAFYVARWQRGLLPVAAALAILFAVVAAVAGPAWFDRDKAGFDDPALDPAILGMLTIILVPVQILLIVFAMRGFQQEWNVEIEVAQEDADRYRRGDISASDLHAATE